MHISVSTSDLCRAMSLVSGCVEKKSTIPILSNVLLRAEGQSVVITGTDLAVALAIRIDAKVTEPGDVAIPARKLNDYARLLPDGQVSLKTGANSWVTIEAGRAKSRIAGMGSASFPEIPAAPDASMSVSAVALLRLIRQTEFAISKEESRFTLTGALLECKDGRANLVATDGHRLALAWTELQAPAAKFIIPLAAMRALQKIGGAEEVYFSQDENHLFFMAGESELTVRKMSGNFPDYERVLPKEPPIKVTVNTDDLKGALSRVSQFSDERSRAVKFALSKDGLEVSASTAEAGESTESIPCDYSGDSLALGLNSGYVMDFISAVSTESVVIGLNTPSDAAQFTPAGVDDFRVVIMPMRI